MAIVVTCPRCDRKYSLADTMAGRRVTCKECQQEFGVPGRSSSVARTKPSAWDDDDGGEIAFASPPPRSAYDDEPAKVSAGDEGFRPPPRVKARSSSGTKSSTNSNGWGLQGSTSLYIRIGIAVVVALFGFLGGREYLFDTGNTPHANDAVALMQEYATLLNEMSSLIDQGSDPESFQRLAPQMADLQNRNQALMSKIQAIGLVTGAEERYIKRQVGPTMREALTRTKIAMKKFEAFPMLAGRLAMWNSQMDQELKRWGGPTREIPSGPPPSAVPSVEVASPAPTPVLTKPSAKFVYPEGADDVAKSLVELNSPDTLDWHVALTRLETATPDTRADEVVRAVIPKLAPIEGKSHYPGKVINILAAWRTPEGVQTICNCVSDDRVGVYNAAMEALGKIKVPEGIVPIIGRLESNGYSATRALVAYGPEIEKTLIPYLTDPNPRIRAGICDVLKEIGGKDTLVAMSELPPDPVQGTQVQAKTAWDAIVKRVGPLPGTSKPKASGKSTGKGKR